MVNGPKQLLIYGRFKRFPHLADYQRIDVVLHQVVDDARGYGGGLAAVTPSFEYLVKVTRAGSPGIVKSGQDFLRRSNLR